MSWLVFGASGFVGSEVVKAARQAGINVHGASAPRLSTRSLIARGLAAEAAEAADPLRDVVRGYDVVVNAAGLAKPGSPDTAELRGANALLPIAIAQACADTGVSRFIHLSSAAVQGRRHVLDETGELEPFSAYSRSKALGEQALGMLAPAGLEIVILRATSVQGTDRPTTAAIARLAASPFASVASPGTAATPITSVAALADLVVALARHAQPVAPIVLQPSEGMTVRSVLEAAGGKSVVLPARVCRVLLNVGYAVSSLAGERLHGALRRVELMWFGQAQAPGWAEAHGIRVEPRVRAVLAAAARPRALRR